MYIVHLSVDGICQVMHCSPEGMQLTGATLSFKVDSSSSFLVLGRTSKKHMALQPANGTVAKFLQLQSRPGRLWTKIVFGPSKYGKHYRSQRSLCSCGVCMPLCYSLHGGEAMLLLHPGEWGAGKGFGASSQIPSTSVECQVCLAIA